MVHQRTMPRSDWEGYELDMRVAVFEDLESQFKLSLAQAAQPAHLLGVVAWRVTPDSEARNLGVPANMMQLEVTAPVYQPSREPTPSFETRPTPAAESAGAATRALIMAANELAVAVRVMIGDRELHVLHRPVRKLEQALAAWPHPFTQEQEAAPTTEQADQPSRTAHLAKVDQLLAKALQDATRPMGDHRAAEIAVRLLEHQAALLGLYPDGDS